MKKRNFLFLLSFAGAACNKNSGPTPEPCLAEQKEDQRCNQTKIETCDGNYWVQSSECAAEGKTCKPAAGGVSAAVCGPAGIKVEFQLCSDDCAGNLVCRYVSSYDASFCFQLCDPRITQVCDNGNACAPLTDAAGDGVCSNTVPGGANVTCFGETYGSCQQNFSCEPMVWALSNICVDACDPSSASDTCTSRDANLYCQPLNPLAQNDGTCWKKAARDNVCLPDAPDTACQGEEGLSCSLTRAGLASYCKRGCPTSDVNQPGSSDCAAAEQCLASPFVEVQKVGEVEVVCPTLGASGAPCDPGFVCHLSPSDRSKQVCSRPTGWCGVAAPIFAGNLDITTLSQLSVDKWCNQPYESHYCPADSNGGQIECATASLAALYTQLACASDVDCAVNGLDCISVSSGSFCGLFRAVCVRFCEDELGGALSCPSAYTCTPPNTRIGAAILQGGASARVSCVGDPDCDGTQNFKCDTFIDGKFCARYRKYCKAD